MAEKEPETISEDHRYPPSLTTKASITLRYFVLPLQYPGDVKTRDGRKIHVPESDPAFVIWGATEGQMARLSEVLQPLTKGRLYGGLTPEEVTAALDYLETPANEDVKSETRKTLKLPENTKGLGGKIKGGQAIPAWRAAGLKSNWQQPGAGTRTTEVRAIYYDGPVEILDENGKPTLDENGKPLSEKYKNGCVVLIDDITNKPIDFLTPEEARAQLKVNGKPIQLERSPGGKKPRTIVVHHNDADPSKRGFYLPEDTIPGLFGEGITSKSARIATGFNTAMVGLAIYQNRDDIIRDLARGSTDDVLITGSYLALGGGSVVADGIVINALRKGVAGRIAQAAGAVALPLGVAFGGFDVWRQYQNNDGHAMAMAGGAMLSGLIAGGALALITKNPLVIGAGGFSVALLGGGLAERAFGEEVEVGFGLDSRQLARQLTDRKANAAKVQTLEEKLKSGQTFSPEDKKLFAEFYLKIYLDRQFTKERMDTGITTDARIKSLELLDTMLARLTRMSNVNLALEVNDTRMNYLKGLEAIAKKVDNQQRVSQADIDFYNKAKQFLIPSSRKIEEMKSAFESAGDINAAKQIGKIVEIMKDVIGSIETLDKALQVRYGYKSSPVDTKLASAIDATQPQEYTPSAPAFTGAKSTAPIQRV